MNKAIKGFIAGFLITSLFILPNKGGLGKVQAQNSFPPVLQPYLSADGLTLYNGVKPLVLVVDPDPARRGIQVPRAPEVQAAIDAAVADPIAASAAFSITFKAAGTTDPWDAVCAAFPAAAQTAFYAAAAIWTSTIQSSVPITISACWSNLGSSILGYSGGYSMYRNFTGAPKENTWYASSLADALSGSERGLAGEYDDYITYNSNFTWYTGTDGVVPSGQYDLVTVAAHEIAHGLNFAGTASYASGTGSYGYGTGYPNIYDTFMEDSGGTKLTTYSNPSTNLGSLLTSGNLWFNGVNSKAANGGTRVKMYAPGTWSSGSSYAHLDYSTFAGTVNSMMVYAVASGSSQHNPGPVTKGLLKDLGWVMAGETTTTSMYLPLVLKSHNTVSGWTTIMREDFEGAFPGSWELWSSDGGIYSWGKRPCRPYEGSYSGWGVGGGSSGALLPCGSDYPDNANSWMTYGPFSLADTTKADLSFKLWLNTEFDYDMVCQYASVNNVNFYGTCTWGDSGGWIDHSLDLTNVYTLGNLVGQSNVWMALRFYSDYTFTYAEGGYVDNILLRKCNTGATCPAAIVSAQSADSHLIEIPSQMTRP
jgi:hypothetical protein